jgi:hypothetical protein
MQRDEHAIEALRNQPLQTFILWIERMRIDPFALERRQHHVPAAQ